MDHLFATNLHHLSGMIGDIRADMLGRRDWPFDHLHNAWWVPDLYDFE